VRGGGVEPRVIPERLPRKGRASGDIRRHEVPQAALQLPSPPPNKVDSFDAIGIEAIDLFYGSRNI